MSRARQIADQVHAFLGDACQDLAHTVDLEFFDGETAKAIQKARKDGVRDLRGWLADYLYNDPDTLRDLASDKIHDLAEGDASLSEEVLLELKRVLPKIGMSA